LLKKSKLKINIIKINKFIHLIKFIITNRNGQGKENNERYNKMRIKYEEIENQLKKHSKFLKRLKKSLFVRDETINMFLQSQSLKCNMNFQDYLQSRDYNGILKFDHENLTLDVVINTNKSKEAKKRPNDLRSLSGGERSFSTVAFLLALWSTVDSPILFLDEFDVFMVKCFEIVLK
jgi:chromosome segregation ATPase